MPVALPLRWHGMRPPASCCRTISAGVPRPRPTPCTRRSCWPVNNSATGGAVLVEGEAGIGKTALIAEWQGRSSAFAVTLVGRCDELGRDLSLQPVLDALAAFLRGMEPDDVRELLGAHVDLIGPLV